MTSDRTTASAIPWQVELKRRLPLFGHRNWIVVADSAYPAQSSPGIETILADGSHFETVEAVLAAVEAAQHVRATIYSDLELDFVADSDAPGVSELRRRLSGILSGPSARKIRHEEIIARLDDFSKLFRVLIIKTSLTIPYTSIFFELECGYWNQESESRLRGAMEETKSSIR